MGNKHLDCSEVKAADTVASSKLSCVLNPLGEGRVTNELGLHTIMWVVTKNAMKTRSNLIVY